MKKETLCFFKRKTYSLNYLSGQQQQVQWDSCVGGNSN